VPTITCTRHLAGVGPCEPVPCVGQTVGEAIARLAADYPRLPSYVLDDQGRVRKHVTIFVNGSSRPRQSVLELPLAAEDTIHILQALSGG